ncbi:hypothetical protein ACSBR1_013708 [Camellia fascicularis]
MEKNQRTLTIPFISAKDLERVKLSNNMEVYAYVSISGGAKQKTAVDRDGDTNPTWKGHITFNLDKEYVEDWLKILANTLPTSNMLANLHNHSLFWLFTWWDSIQGVGHVKKATERRRSGLAASSLESLSTSLL